MTKEKIREAVVRAFYISGINEVNQILLNEIIEQVWQTSLDPNLGSASTLMLISELDVRARAAAAVGEEWPKYRTVDSS